jgi:hypothetical protein
MKQKRISMKGIHLLFVLLLFSLAALPSAAAASAGAVYKSVNGNKVVFLVEVGIPAPASLIVQHFHPQGTRLLAASPSADQINNGAGTSKWLIKNVRPGVYPFSLSFDGRISPADLKIILRYHDPKTGSFREIVIRP